MSRISPDIPPPAVAISGYSGSGKTTLIESTISRLFGRGLAVGYLKADAHRIDADERAKDSQRARQAGAAVSMVSQADESCGWEHHMGDFTNPPSAVERRLIEHCARSALFDLKESFRGCDLLLVEGMKYSALPKVLVNRLDNPRGILPRESLRRVLMEIRSTDSSEAVRAAEEAIGSVLDSPARKAACGMAGVVLAGGPSSRMGRDKALLPLNYPQTRACAVTWLERACCLLSQCFSKTVIAGRVIDAGGNGSPSFGTGFESFTDKRPGAGPLSGIESALERLACAVLVLPCDLPLMDEEVIDLLMAGRDGSASATLFHDENGLPMPLPLIVEPDALRPLTRYLESGGRSVAGFLAMIGVKLLRFPQELRYQLANINTLEDLKSLS